MIGSEQRAFTITYSTTFEEHRRCGTYRFFRTWVARTTLSMLGLMVAYILAQPVYVLSPIAAFITFPLFFAAGFAIWTLFLRCIFWLEIKKRFPSPNTVRVCTSSLSGQGFHDATPDGTSLSEWNQVKDIREVQGDIYISAGLGNNRFIPRSAFPDEEAMRQFYLAAVTLWKSNGLLWPGEAIA